jgi:hypothetical protein
MPKNEEDVAMQSYKTNFNRTSLMFDDPELSLLDNLDAFSKQFQQSYYSYKKSKVTLNRFFLVN